MISPINTTINNYNNYKQKKNINFKAIHINEIAAQFNPIKNQLLAETQKFVKDGNGVKKIGEGVFSEAFKFNKFSNLVIKASKITDNFKNEMTALKWLPSSLKRSQQFAARAFDDDTYKYYLITTKVEGESPDPKKRPWDLANLKSLFNGLFELDKAGIYHGDLNNGNIKIEKNGNVNFLDFQWSTKVDKANLFEANEAQCLPRFIPLNNGQMFEMAEVPYYLNKMNDSRDGENFLASYLHEKSRYQGKRNEYFYNITENWPYSLEIPYVEKALKFESAQEEIYKSLDNKTLKLETLKIQFLNAFREASKYLDANTPHKNILAAPSSYLYALNCIQALRNEIYTQKNGYINKTRGEYLDGLSDFADYWYNNIKSWSVDAFNYPYRHAKNELISWENRHNFNDPEINVAHFDNMSNIAPLVADNFDPKFTRNFSYWNSDATKYLDEVKSYVKSYGTQEMKKTYDNIYEAYLQDRGLDIINQSLLLTLQANKAQLYNLERYASFLAKEVFNNIHNDIVGEPYIGKHPGYKNMNTFV